MLWKSMSQASRRGRGEGRRTKNLKAVLTQTRRPPPPPPTSQRQAGTQACPPFLNRPLLEFVPSKLNYTGQKVTALLVRAGTTPPANTGKHERTSGNQGSDGKHPIPLRITCLYSHMTDRWLKDPCSPRSPARRWSAHCPAGSTSVILQPDEFKPSLGFLSQFNQGHKILLKSFR